ncbi:GNAT family N-acetyltransferase [Paenibacillus sp. SAF-054]
MIYETGEIITTEIYRVSPEEKDELNRLSAERHERLREEAVPNIRKRYEQMAQLQKGVYTLNITFEPVKQEVEELVQFLTSDRWPYHGVENPTESNIRNAYASGAYHNENTQTFWIVDKDSHQKIGLIRLFEVTDPIVMLDLRIRGEYRGKGIGKSALRWIVSHVFTEFPEVIRIEGHTRVDNSSMRALFAKSLFVLEAYHRKSWRQEGLLFDSVGYAVIRADWENNQVTPIPWSIT